MAETGSIVSEEGKIKCIITGKLRKETPEEYVRQEFCRVLLNVYKYPKEHIDIEFSIKVGREPKRIDIAIFNSEIKSQDNVYIAVETKKKKEEEGREQLQSYVNATTANFGVWTNGEQIVYVQKIMGVPNKLQDLPDIPKYGQSVDVIGKYKKSDLVAATDLKSIFTRCNNYFYTNQGLTQDKRFAEILKVLFCKIEDEKNYSEEDCEFYITPLEKESITGLKRFRDRITSLFERVKKRYETDNIFDKRDEIILNDRCLSFAVAEFQKYSMLETDADIKGVAFETFVGDNLRGEHGEFFTPREVVRMAAQMVMPKIGETVCDPACGSGGFLVMILKKMTPKFQEIASKKTRMSSDALLREYADKYIRGIDFNPDLARVAKMNMVLNDDGHTGIFHRDSLIPFEEWDETLLEKIRPDSIDIVLTNPPFGKKCVIDDKKILRNFDLGHRWEKNESGKWVMTDQVEHARTPDILFIERCLDLLRPHGRMAIVLPDGILGNDHLGFVRQYILQRALLVAIIDCPVETFLPTVDTKTSVLVLKKKEDMSEPQTFDVFMAVAKTCGHDRRGKKTYVRDTDGGIVYDVQNKPKVDNDLDTIAKRFLEYARSKNIYD
ncbi:MAG: N-6 DNA methylase [archaeon]|nr:N-6 DNA methylase [archaeon]